MKCKASSEKNCTAVETTFKVHLPYDTVNKVCGCIKNKCFNWKTACTDILKIYIIALVLSQGAHMFFFFLQWMFVKQT